MYSRKYSARHSSSASTSSRSTRSTSDNRTTTSDISSRLSTENYIRVTQNLCTQRSSRRPCGNCIFKIDSQTLLRSLSFQDLIGIMQSLLLPTIGSVGSLKYSECTVTCAAFTTSVTKVVSKDTKIICDTIFCRYLASDWLAYNGFHKANLDAARELTEIAETSTDTQGLVTALSILFDNYDIWDMSV